MTQSSWSFSKNIQIVDKEKKYSLKDLNVEIEKMSTVFDQVQTGDVIAIEGDFSFVLIAAIFSLWQKGAVIMPVASFSILDKTDIYFDYKLDRNFKLLKCTQSSGVHFHLEKLKKEAGVIFFTSGSTGKPKFVLHNVVKLFSKTQETKIKSSLLFLKFNHFGGLFTLIKLLKSGCKIVIVSDHNPNAVLEMAQKNEVELLPVTPTFLALANALGSFDNKIYPHLKYISYGTEVMPENLLIKLNTKMPKVKFIQTYGLTEVGVLKTKSESSESLNLFFDQHDFQTRVSMEGKLEIKKDQSSLVEIIENGLQVEIKEWIETGDLVKETSPDHFRIISRASSLVIIGGEKVVPEEVEDVLLGFKDVIKAYVYPKKNELLGMHLCADIYFMMFDETEDVLKKQIKMYCLRNLDPHKVPVEINLKTMTDFQNYSLKTLRN